MSDTSPNYLGRIANLASELLGIELKASEVDLYDGLGTLRLAYNSLHLAEATTDPGPCGVLLGRNNSRNQLESVVVYGRGETNDIGLVYVQSPNRIILATQMLPDSQAVVEVVNREQKPYREKRLMHPYIRDGALVEATDQKATEPGYRLEKLISVLPSML